MLCRIMLLCLCTGITMQPDNSKAVNLETTYSLENLMGKMGWDFPAINYCCSAGAVCLSAQLQEQTTYVLLTLCKVREPSVNLHRSSCTSASEEEPWHNFLFLCNEEFTVWRGVDPCSVIHIWAVVLWLGHRCHKSLGLMQEERWLYEIVACPFQELHGGEPGERSPGSAEDELPRNEAVLPTQISECPVGSHGGEHCLCPPREGPR